MWNIEVTDTYGGDANYSWVRRYTAQDRASKLALVRAVKRAAGYSGVRATVTWFGSDELWIRPRGVCVVIIAYWQEEA